MEFESNRPIYLQIVDEIKSRIVSGSYEPGEKLPSVRDFAAELSVRKRGADLYRAHQWAICE